MELENNQVGIVSTSEPETRQDHDLSNPNQAEAESIVQELLRDHSTSFGKDFQARIVLDGPISVMNAGIEDSSRQERLWKQNRAEPSKFLFQRGHSKGQPPVIEEVSWSQTSQSASEQLQYQRVSKVSSIKPVNTSQNGSITYHGSFAGYTEQPQDLHNPYLLQGNQAVHYQSEQSRDTNSRNHLEVPAWGTGFKKQKPTAQGAYSSVTIERPIAVKPTISHPASSGIIFLQQTGGNGAAKNFDSNFASGYQSGHKSNSSTMNKYYEYLESLLGGFPDSLPIMTRAGQTSGHKGSGKITSAAAAMFEKGAKKTKISIKKIRRAVGREQAYYEDRTHYEPLYYEELDKDYETPVECLDLDTAKTPEELGGGPEAEDSDHYGGGLGTHNRGKSRQKRTKLVNISKVKKYVDNLETPQKGSKNGKRTKIYTKSGIGPADWKDDRFRSAFRSSSKDQTKNLKVPSKSPLKSASRSSVLPAGVSPSSLNKQLRREQQKRVEEQEKRIKQLEEMDREQREKEEREAKRRREEARRELVLSRSKQKAEQEERLRASKERSKQEVEEARRSRREQQEQLLARNEKERELRRVSKGSVEGLDRLRTVSDQGQNTPPRQPDSQRQPLTQNTTANGWTYYGEWVGYRRAKYKSVAGAGRGNRGFRVAAVGAAAGGEAGDFDRRLQLGVSSREWRGTPDGREPRDSPSVQSGSQGVGTPPECGHCGLPGLLRDHAAPGLAQGVRPSGGHAHEQFPVARSDQGASCHSRPPHPPGW